MSKRRFGRSTDKGNGNNNNNGNGRSGGNVPGSRITDPSWFPSNIGNRQTDPNRQDTNPLLNEVIPPLVNPLRPNTQGPLNFGFGGVSNVGSQGLSVGSNGFAAGSKPGAWGTNFSGAANALNNGNFLDFLTALFPNQKNMPNEILQGIFQSYMQYGLTADQRQYDQLVTQDQRNYDQKVLQDQRQYDWNLTQDQRAYDRSVLADQRLYDSPTNQLARLMGAGISRDAAIQMLSGGSAGVAGSAGAPVSSGGLGSGSPFAGSAQSINGIDVPGNQQIAIANTVFNGFKTLCDLLNAGLSMTEGIQAVKAMDFQNTMNQQQLDAYNSVNELSSFVNNQVLSGSIPVATVQGWHNANDVYNGLIGLKDDPNFAPVVNSPSFKRVFGSTLGRNMMNKYWSDMRESEHAGDIYENYVQQADLRSDIMKIDRDTAHANLESCFKQLLQQDADLQRTYQQIRNGEIEIKINDQVLRANTYQNDIDQVYHDAYLESMNTYTSPEGILGKNLLSDLTFKQMYDHWRRLATQQSPENREKYIEFLQNDFDAACSMAIIKAAASKQLQDTWDSDTNNLGPLWTRFTNIFFGTKTDQILQLGGQAAGTAAQLGTTLYLGRHNDHFKP